MPKKSIFYKILKTIWLIIGILLLLLTIVAIISTGSTTNIGGAIFGTALLFAGIYGLVIYLVITLIFLALKYVFKKIMK